MQEATGGGGSGGLWVNLVVGIIGAFAGSAATLAGSILVNRWDLRRTARLRLYQELLPKVKNGSAPSFGASEQEREAFALSLHALERTAAIAGPIEWRCAVIVRINGETYARLLQEDPDSFGSIEEFEEKLTKDIHSYYDSLSRLDKVLQDHVRNMWPMWRLRLRDKLRKLLRRQPRSRPS